VAYVEYGSVRSRSPSFAAFAKIRALLEDIKIHIRYNRYVYIYVYI